MNPYEVVLYEDEKGYSQVSEWLAELQRSNPRERAKAARLIEKLEKQGTGLKMPHCKHIEGPIWELRKDGIRVYYWQEDKTTFVAAAGEVKQRDEADSALLRYAQRAYKEYNAS